MQRFMIALLAFVAMANATMARGNVSSGYVVNVDNDSIYYEIHGEGEPLILLHGHTLDMRMWRQQVSCFSRKYKVITLDFCGYGKSSSMKTTKSTAHADDVLTLMDALGIERAHIVGLSMGGFVAGDLVGIAPQRLLSCVMCSGAMRTKHPSINEPVDSVEIAKGQENIAAVHEKGVETWRREWIEKLINGGGSKRETMRKELTEIICDWDCWQILNIEPHLYYGHEAYERLKTLRPSVPTMYLSGEMEHKKRMGILDYLPNSKQIELKDCGHMSNMERPKQFNKAILDFLKSCRK